MAPTKKSKDAPEVPAPVAVPTVYQLYLQEIFTRTELERRAALDRVRSDLKVPEGMAYAPEAGVFMVPPAAPTGPELVTDESD